MGFFFCFESAFVLCLFLISGAVDVKSERKKGALLFCMRLRLSVGAILFFFFFFFVRSLGGFFFAFAFVFFFFLLHDFCCCKEKKSL